jgi:hypothetical protein
MDKTERNPGNNVVRMPAKPGANRKATPRFDAASGSGVLAAAGSPDDPRMQEALRLAKAFLAIEDAQARGALVALAESLVSRDWPLGAQRL